MSGLYTNSIKTRILDPVFNKSNFRCEFRIPDGCYLSNFRLTDMGVSSTGSQGLYNFLVGSLIGVKNVFLYDGNVLIDALYDVPKIVSFKNLNTTNDANSSVNNYVRNNGLGFIGSGYITPNPASGIDAKDQIKLNNARQGLPQNIRLDDTTTDSSVVQLRRILPFLNASRYVPVSVYPKLRLVLEFNNSQEMLDLVAGDTNGITSLNTIRPSLIVDEVIDEAEKQAILADYSGVNWKAIENDRVNAVEITGMTDGTPEKTQSNNWSVDGFTNKTLNNLIVAQVNTDTSVYVDGTEHNTFNTTNASRTLWKPKYQFRVNGMNKISRDGWEGKNRRLGHLVDTFGELNLPSVCNQTHLEDTANTLGNTDLVGSVDYTGIFIGERVKQLQVQVERVGVYGNTDTSQALDIHLFGEVNKSIVVNGGSYNVIYS